jgi:HAE1 family hydrophobic/amphiphilic exporter-1
VGTIGGMLIGTIALLFIVPPLFFIFQKIEERVMGRRKRVANKDITTKEK